MKLIIATVLILASCAPVPSVSITVARFDSIERPQTTDIRVYSSPETVGREYREIALFTARKKASEAEMIGFMVQKAQELGADGLIILPPDETPGPKIPAMGLMIPTKRVIYRVSAIVFE